ncbi:hypothetical protein NE237_006260 [Protea cynaroides]|uniref:Uncharacterized protein n=1 Tax=Protea cynaroides TaxID=273540 RepID=A0A9Q0KMU9_9MAGN|nr:hypothetical protein NE237_006260 [Protea cynaroides]
MTIQHETSQRQTVQSSDAEISNDPLELKVNAVIDALRSEAKGFGGESVTVSKKKKRSQSDNLIKKTSNGEEDDNNDNIPEVVFETVDGNNVKVKPNEKIAALSIPTVKPAESRSDITTNDCIDHVSGTSGGQYEETKNMEDYPKSLVPDGDLSRCSEPDKVKSIQLSESQQAQMMDQMDQKP